MADSAGEQRKLTAEILTYFVENPEAIDNLEGISEWRLLGSRVRSAVESTQQVLESLAKQGYLQKIETRSGPLFQINREKLEEARRALHEGKDL